MSDLKKVWLTALLLPLIVHFMETMCVWSSPRWLGETTFCLMLATAWFGLSVLVALPCAIYCFGRGIANRKEPGQFVLGGSYALMWSVYFVLSVIVMRHDFSVRHDAFIRASKSGDRVVQALTQYKRDHEKYPEELKDLCPTYLPEIPFTGLIGYPEFKYRKDYHDIDRQPGEYELRINCSSGGINFDRFIYWPSEQYPNRIQGNGVERIGKWAYVHE